MRKIDTIVIHASDTPPSMDVDAAEIRRWHVEDNGWRDIGYHWVVRRSGELEAGRPEPEPGAHVAGHNAHSIGICMVGGRKEGGGPDSNYTLAQWSTLHELLANLAERFPDAKVVGHRDLDSSKACPCFDAKVLL